VKGLVEYQRESIHSKDLLQQSKSSRPQERRFLSAAWRLSLSMLGRRYQAGGLFFGVILLSPSPNLPNQNPPEIGR
jgi:hypothetical protein